MVFSIQIEIDLTDDEIKFIKKIFLQNRNRNYNITFENIKNIRSGKVYNIPPIKSLAEKNVIAIDNIGNSSLTQIGQMILDNFDREKKLNDLLK